MVVWGWGEVMDRGRDEEQDDVSITKLQSPD